MTKVTMLRSSDDDDVVEFSIDGKEVAAIDESINSDAVEEVKKLLVALSIEVDDRTSEELVSEDDDETGEAE